MSTESWTAVAKVLTNISNSSAPFRLEISLYRWKFFQNEFHIYLSG